MATNNALNLSLSGSTGTGSFVGSDAPTIVNGIWQSPTINSPAGTVLTVSSTGTPVNQFVMTASPTTAAPVLSVAGTDSNILLQINGKGTSGLGLQGASTNSNAVAGNVGEFISSVSGSVSLTSSVSANITSISLTAGDWDVWGLASFSGTATSSTNGILGVSITSGFISGSLADNTSAFQFAPTLNFATFGTSYFNVAPARISIASTTTVYFVANCTFSGGTCACTGAIRARRQR